MHKPNQVPTTCQYCGAAFTRTPSRLRRATRHFCSRECDNEWRRSRPVDSIDTMRERFYERVVVSDEDSCWLWVGAYNGDYGRMPRGRGRGFGAHRASYLIHHGEIPNGMEVCHSCDNPSCVNPYHLFAGTHADNMRDMKEKGKRRGVLQARAKLTDADIPVIWRMRAEGHKQEDIAKRFGMSRTGIANVLQGHTWTHVPREDS